MNFWEGEKIRLRAIEPSDASLFIRWNKNSERARHIDFLWPPSSDASVEAWAETKSKQGLEHDTFHWVIETVAGEPVGSISTHHCDPRNGTFMYGVDVAPEHRRNGYASEAIRLVIRYYFEERRYQKVNAIIHSDNVDSIVLHERLGFQLEGRQRRMVFTQGNFVDLVWFGMTKEEFENVA